MKRHQLTERIVEDLLALVPWARDFDGREVEEAIEFLIRSEKLRRGEPDPLTGLAGHLAMLQGTLLHLHLDPGQFRTATHFSGLVLDVKSLRIVNETHGRDRGNELLALVAKTVRESRPDGLSIRGVGDAFANIVVADVPDRELLAWRDSLRDRFLADVTRLVSDWGSWVPGQEEWEPAATIACLNLTVIRPHSWRVLGPLLFEEGDRAYIVERAGATGVQHRTINLDGLP